MILSGKIEWKSKEIREKEKRDVARIINFVFANKFIGTDVIFWGVNDMNEFDE